MVEKIIIHILTRSELQNMDFSHKVDLNVPHAIFHTYNYNTLQTPSNKVLMQHCDDIYALKTDDVL